MATILVAEDDTNIRNLITFCLDAEGHDVTAVADGDAALAALRADLPDLAVLDIMMPGLTGLEVCRRVRDDQEATGMAVIMLTALGEEPDLDAGFSVGADDYVKKPFSPRDLARRVEEVLAWKTR